MKSLWALCALALSGACACASAAVLLPLCDERDARIGACAGAGPRLTPGGWNTNHYVVNGKRLSVETRGGELRWRCARGLDPAARPAPRFNFTYQATSMELIDCEISQPTYSGLLTSLTVNTKRLTVAFITSQHRNERWPSTDELKAFEKNRLNADTKPQPPAPNLLQHLSLRGIPMTVNQLANIRHIETLTLDNTGLDEVMDLSGFDRLTRLELWEPGLRDARRLASAPALVELVLRAPDAALAALPRLRSATFVDAYALESVFGDCGRLEELAVEGGELAAVRAHWLVGCTRLRRLRLSRLRRLRALPWGLLAYATALQTLNLSGNALEALPDDLLAGAARLTALDLTDNALFSLPADFFRNATSLALVSLRDNPDLTPKVPESLGLK